MEKWLVAHWTSFFIGISALDKCGGQHEHQLSALQPAVLHGAPQNWKYYGLGSVVIRKFQGEALQSVVSGLPRLHGSRNFLLTPRNSR
jgi:hypothetical protein